MDEELLEDAHQAVAFSNEEKRTEADAIAKAQGKTGHQSRSSFDPHNFSYSAPK